MSSRILLRCLSGNRSVSRPILQVQSSQPAPAAHMSMLDYFRRKKPENKIDEDSDEGGQIVSLEESVRPLSEEEINKKRNKSGLMPHHQRLLHGEFPPYAEPDTLVPDYTKQSQTWIYKTIKFRRKMFGTYGEKSGINPGIVWPTVSELKNKLEYESVSNPFTIQEMVNKKRALRAAEQTEFERREQEVDKQMKLVEKFKQELIDKQAAKERELEAAKARKEKLMDEVRRHFGFTVDPKDERFQEMLAKKEKEQRKEMKEARKLEKQKRALEKVESLDNSKSTKKPPKTPDVDDD